jgi:adenylate cyclase
MANIFRSISSKIFGFSVVLLMLMVGTAAWSAIANKEVHKSLQTLELSMFPLASTVAKINHVAQAQKGVSDYFILSNSPDLEAQCLEKINSQAAALRGLMQEAKRFSATGSKIAFTERVKISMARFEVQIAYLNHQEQRLSKMTQFACGQDAEAAQFNEFRNQASDIEQMSSALDNEIHDFVATSSRLIAENQQRAEQASIVMIFSAAMVGMMLAWLVSRGLTRPISRLLIGARSVSSGLLDEAHVPVTSRDEIGDVTHAFNLMIVELREKEHIKETFGQYVDPRIVAGLLSGAERSSVGEKQIATVFFSDIVGFSAIAERLAPSTLVDLVNAYFSEMSQAIHDYSGIIDKYIGDAIMAFWVPPFVDATQQAGLACKAALEQFSRLETFRARVPDVIGLRRDVPLIDLRVGLSTGEVVVGSVGSDMARSFTVMGDTVNQASRLEAANKIYGTHIIIDHNTFASAGNLIETREIDTITVLGRMAPQCIYELVGMAGDLSPASDGLFELYAEGLEHYRHADWTMAERALRAALEINSGDGPSTTLLARVSKFQLEPPHEWDGIWRMESK